MLNCLNNDNKIQMRQNIQLHRQKLLQILEKTNDTVLKPKIKLVSNNIEKIASTTEFQKPKLNQSTISVTNLRDKSRIRIKTYEPVLNTKAKNLEVLTGIDVKKEKTRSSNTVNQLQPKDKIIIREEPLSNVKLILEPSPIIEIRDAKPPVIVKKLKEQLIEELFDSSSSEEIDDISVGINDDWNEIYQTDNENNYENDISSVSNNSSLTGGVPYDEHERLANDRSEEEYLYYSGDSENSVLNNYPTTTKIRRTRKMMMLTNPEFQPKHRFRKPQDRTIHNAKERACRERIAKRFDILKKCCSYLNTNRRVASKHSILLAAKKECDLLYHFEQKMVAEKKGWSRANEVLKKRIAEFYRKNYDNSNLARLK